jgi:hypothetical protein
MKAKFTKTERKATKRTTNNMHKAADRDTKHVRKDETRTARKTAAKIGELKTRE